MKHNFIFKLLAIGSAVTIIFASDCLAQSEQVQETDVPSGFAEFLANKDVQKALNKSNNGSDILKSADKTKLYKIGLCKNTPSVWASSVKPKVKGKSVGVFKVYTIVKPYKTVFKLNLDDLALAEVDDSQCYFEYEIDIEDMPSEYYPAGPYYRIGSKSFFYPSKDKARENWPSNIKEDGTGTYADDKQTVCQKTTINRDYSFPEKIRKRPNFMKEGWGHELKFVTNHSKHCG